MGFQIRIERDYSAIGEFVEHTTPPPASRVEQLIEQIQHLYEQFICERD